MTRAWALVLFVVLVSLPVDAGSTATDGCGEPIGAARLALHEAVPLAKPVPGIGPLDAFVPPATVGDGTPCVGAIRPGAPYGDPYVQCTLSWILRDGDGALYVMTAGHCTGPGGVVDTLQLGVFAEVVYHSTGLGRDYALARIYEHMYPYVDPSVCHWGGPTGVAEPLPGMPILTYGWGVGNNLGPVDSPTDGRARAGVTVHALSQAMTYVGLSVPGDSGGPILNAQHQAIGIVTHGAPPLGYGTQLHRVLPTLSEALGTEFELVTAPVPLVPGAAPGAPTA